VKYGLKMSTLEGIIDVLSRNPKIEKVVLYGSRAKGSYKNGFDIDLALVGKNINIEDLNKILLELDELYLPYSFDLVIFERIENEALLNHINRVGITIYQRN
jgi:predicted nucleotidyltransferase